MFTLRSLYKRTLFVTLLAASATPVSVYSQDLSGIYYSRQKDSLQKNWTCPTIFFDKAIQKKYQQLWDKRTQQLTTAIADNQFVHDTLVNPYLDAIVQQITKGNGTMVPVKPMLLLDRSPLANAWSPGGNIVVIDLGMMVFARTREELALVIAHEMAHNILHHYEWTIQQKAKNATTEANRQLQHEKIADSFAIVLLRNSHIGFDARYFLHADSSDQVLHQPLAHPLTWYFTSRHLPCETAWLNPGKGGLPAAGAPDEESATHPDGMNRFMSTRKVTAWRTTPSRLPGTLTEAANKMLIKSLYESGKLTACLYRILLRMDKPDTDSWYEVLFSSVFHRLYEEDNRLARGEAIDAKPKEYLSADYYALQTMLERIPHDMLQRYGKIPLPVEATFRSEPKVIPQPRDLPAQMEPIRKDGRLAGYLVLTQLEKTGIDSFVYHLTFSDENLNDIGSFTFHDKQLLLKEAALQGDVLCLLYIKSNFIGNELADAASLNQVQASARLFAQFVTLRGRLLNQYSCTISLHPEADSAGGKLIANAQLAQPLQLRTIDSKGFVCIYGDDNQTQLLLFSTDGKLSWQKTIRDAVTGLHLLTSGADIYLLLKKQNRMTEGGYEIISYNSRDTSSYPRLLLTDRKGNALKVLSFDNDPVTGNPYIAGLIIDSLKGNNYLTGEQLTHGPYSGVFTIQLNGHRRKDIQTAFSYWSNGTQSFLGKDGYHCSSHSYPNMEKAFRDCQGNTWFTGTGIIRKSRQLIGGAYKYASSNILMMRQDATGRCFAGTTIATPATAWVDPSTLLTDYPEPDFYPSTNPDTHTTYLLVNTPDTISIYNVSEKKMERTIARQNDGRLISVYPAKDGFMLVSDINLKEKETRLSIEAL